MESIFFALLALYIVMLVFLLIFIDLTIPGNCVKVFFFCQFMDQFMLLALFLAYLFIWQEKHIKVLSFQSKTLKNYLLICGMQEKMTINVNIELTKTEYKLLIEVLESYIQTNESGMIDEIFYTKSDKVYKLIDKIKILWQEKIF